eukprot:TRINITY_DN8651_c0_g1_i1.p1 TRINITY_DN8651_c0_g1~~TRINITY_DN8651_c0_g1_i1.p1  ORF type:complete len:185 (-),score=43.66 TRINITY_DN8651_c0_g1_i1:124-678(-)
MCEITARWPIQTLFRGSPGFESKVAKHGLDVQHPIGVMYPAVLTLRKSLDHFLYKWIDDPHKSKSTSGGSIKRPIASFVWVVILAELNKEDSTLGHTVEVPDTPRLTGGYDAYLESNGCVVCCIKTMHCCCTCNETCNKDWYSKQMGWEDDDDVLGDDADDLVLERYKLQQACIFEESNDLKTE